MITWYSQEEEQLERAEEVGKFFRDKEIEYETGELVLPGWASIGNVASRYSDEPTPFG